MDIPFTDEPSDPPSGMADPDYRAARRKINHPFNFELDANRREQLRSLASGRAISMGATLRQLISTAYLMEVHLRPHCVSGRACFMPHLHPAPRYEPDHPPTTP